MEFIIKLDSDKTDIVIKEVIELELKRLFDNVEVRIYDNDNDDFIEDRVKEFFETYIKDYIDEEIKKKNIFRPHVQPVIKWDNIWREPSKTYFITGNK